MMKKSQLNYAVIAAMGIGAGCSSVYAQIEEVVVTATKRSQSTQDIPIAVQALGEESLGDLNIANFDDFIKFIPNAVSGGRGPGQSAIFIRGMATDTAVIASAGANGSAPNVALYLDEQPVTMPTRNLDVYVTDIERVEVLAGPQGTLFGASSMAGTVRMITNKPQLNEFDGGFDTSIASTHGGELSNSVEAFINIPLIDDKLAVRLAIYNANEGGYIDNIAGETSIPLSNPGFADNPVPATRQVSNNTPLVEDDFNDSSYQGFRLSAKYAINDDWQVLLQRSEQTLIVDGVFDYDTTLGDLKVQRFAPDELEDVFSQTAWTVQGRIGALELLYTGAYLERQVNQSIDYTGYANVGGAMPGYLCAADFSSCGPNVLTYKGDIENNRQTHEFRVSTPQEENLRVVAGVFYDDVEILDQGDFIYPAIIDNGFVPNDPIPGTTMINPNTRAPDVAFFNDVTRTDEQVAVFGEITYDIVDSLSVTLGARYYQMELDLRGSSNFAQTADNPDGGRNLDVGLAAVAPSDESDTIIKVNITWTPTDDLLLYTTYSEGFRPGGFNRAGGTVVGLTSFYETDEVLNYELGWKTMLFNNTVQFNGAIYFIDWTDIQLAIFDPSISNLSFIDNAADAEILGIEGDIIWVPTDQLTLFAAFSYNDTELTKTPPGVVSILPEGSELALTPKFQGNVRARYEWDVQDYSAYAQLGVVYADESVASIIIAEAFEQDSYVTSDASIGIKKDTWGAEMFVENLTDERADIFISDVDNVQRTTTNRPRTIGVRFSYDL